MKAMCLTAVLTLAAVLAQSVRAEPPSLNVTIVPPRIALGETAQLTLSITGETGNEPALPGVDGLRFTPMGQSSQYQSINGTVTTRISHTYLVTPSRAGTFTIPALKIGTGRDAATSLPVTLQVTGAGSVTAPPIPNPSAPALPLPRLEGARDRPVGSANGSKAFLRINLPKHEFYVGERVPVLIKAYFAVGLQAQLNGLPALSGDAFTMNPLDDQPAQSEEVVDGQPYVALTWISALSAVKAGNYSLSLEMPVRVTIRERARASRSLPGGSFLDDSFFDDFFGRSIEKRLNLRSEADAVKILALPAESRPADFRGAVGRFEVVGGISPARIATGDPITLQFKITGQGNFDLVRTDLLGGSAEWKTYQPVARFTPSDSAGYAGTKTFEQAIIPLQAGRREIPPLQFSFFDPATRQYATRTTAPLAVEVTPSAGGTVAIAPTVNPAPPPRPTAVTDQPPFASNRVETGHFTSTLRPVFLQLWFVVLNLLALVVAMIAHLGMCRRERLARDPRRMRAGRADRAIREQLAAMDAALRHAETAAFFAAARRALQQRLGERWNLPPETITLSEIDTHLNGEADGIRPVFRLADQLAYSGERLPAADLAQWKRRVREELQRLERI